MAKGNNKSNGNGSALDFEAQLWAAAEQAVPAPNCQRRKWWPCASTQSEWFIKDAPQRAEAVQNDALRSRERENWPAALRLAQGRMRGVWEKQFNAERAGVKTV